MAQADETTTAQATDSTEADNDDQPADTTPLPRQFLATASGPVTRVTDHGETTERVHSELAIEHSIETLEEFAAFWTLRDRSEWKASAIGQLPNAHEPDSVAYTINEDDFEKWDVQVDGRVEAFAGVVEAMEGYVGDPTACGEIPHRIAGRIRGLRVDSQSTDEVLESFADELRHAELWGPGAHLAHLNVKHAHHEEIAESAGALASTLSDDGGEA